MNGPSNSSLTPFGFGAQVFGEVLARTPDAVVEPDNGSDAEDDDVNSDEDELVTAVAAITLEGSQWRTAPAYSPMYMSTAAEYLPPAPKVRVSPDEALLDEAAEGGSKEGGWGMEGYENSMNLDQIFERFTRRVGHRGEQCIR